MIHGDNPYCERSVSFLLLHNTDQSYFIFSSFMTTILIFLIFAPGCKDKRYKDTGHERCTPTNLPSTALTLISTVLTLPPAVRWECSRCREQYLPPFTHLMPPPHVRSEWSRFREQYLPPFTRLMPPPLMSDQSGAGSGSSTFLPLPV